MNWQRVTQHNFSDLLRFIIPLEHLCVNFTSRILVRNRPELPTAKEAVLFMCEDTKNLVAGGFSQSSRRGSVVRAAVLVTSKGLLIPVHEENLELSKTQLKPLIEQVYRYVRKVYCVIGIEHTVQQYEGLLKNPIDARRYHYLMIRPKQRALGPISIPPKIEIHTLTDKQVKQIFPLEKAYQYEEVVVHPERFNPAAYFLHFRKVLKNQKILFATFDGIPVSKAGTNAIGMSYTQIGGVFTAPEHRGKGIARVLMHRLVEEIRISGRTAVLFVRTDNKSAIQLYRRLNFDIVGRYQISYTRM